MFAVLRSELIRRRSPRTTRDLGICKLESGANPYFVNAIHSCSSEGRHSRGAIAMLCWPPRDSHRPLESTRCARLLYRPHVRPPGDRRTNRGGLAAQPRAGPDAPGGVDLAELLGVDEGPHGGRVLRGGVHGAVCCLSAASRRHSPLAKRQRARRATAASCRRRYRPRRAQPRLRPPTSPTRLLTILFFATIYALFFLLISRLL